MNDNIKFYIANSDISPVEYTWIDISNYKLPDQYRNELFKILGSLNDLPIKDHPLPFERIAAIVDSPVKPSKESDAVSMVTIVREAGTILYTLHLYIGNSQKPSVVGKITDDHVSLKDMHGKKAMQFHFEPSFKRKMFYAGYNEDQTAEIFLKHYLNSVLKLYALTIKPDPTIPVGRPHGDVTKNAKRQRKGKSQFWEWKTIEIKSITTLPSAPLGGTHSSPKPHERMGHWRKYKSGKRVFIKALIVNKNKIPFEGFVFHDYVKH
jgi:hypothetical protein